MATVVKAGTYDPTNLSSVAFHFGKKGEDAPVLALLAEGADPNAVQGFGDLSAVYWATVYDRPVVVRALLQAGADSSLAGKLGQTPLRGAKSAEVVRLLLEAGAAIDAVTVPNKAGMVGGQTALMNAAHHGRAEVVAALIAAGANIHIRDEAGLNALMLAALSEKSEVVPLLCAAGAEIGLQEAALLGDYPLTRAFLVAGTDLNTGETARALRWAARGGHVEVATLLLDHGAPIDAADTHGRTALMYAASFHRMSVMQLLLEHGANPNAASHRGGTALAALTGTDYGSTHTRVELLLVYGAHPDPQTHNGWTPLMNACLWGGTETVALLLRHGADPNVFSDAEVMAREEGCSTTNPLMLAVGNGHTDIVKLLLAHGADPLAKNNADRCALDSARRRNGHKSREREQILPLLEAAAGVNEHLAANVFVLGR